MMTKRESFGTALMRTDGAKVTTSKYDCRAVGTLARSSLLKFVVTPAWSASTTGASPLTVIDCSTFPTCSWTSACTVRPTSTRISARRTVLNPWSA